MKRTLSFSNERHLDEPKFQHQNRAVRPFLRENADNDARRHFFPKR